MIWFNKWLYGHSSFPYPLLLTTLHMTMTTLLCLVGLFVSSLITRVDALERAFSADDEPLLGSTDVPTTRQRRGSSAPYKDEQFRKDVLLTVTCGIFYALSLSSGSVAYMYLTVPCMQMMKVRIDCVVCS
jgi:hypothetical protein